MNTPEVTSFLRIAHHAFLLEKTMQKAKLYKMSEIP